MNLDERVLGKRIIEAVLDKDGNCHSGILRLTFETSIVMEIFDDGQLCCEGRWISTEDDVTQLVGAKLLAINVVDGPFSDIDEDIKELAFVIIQTTRGQLVLNTYNEHNGYYGGFDVVTKIKEKE